MIGRLAAAAAGFATRIALDVSIVAPLQLLVLMIIHAVIVVVVVVLLVIIVQFFAGDRVPFAYRALLGRL